LREGEGTLGEKCGYNCILVKLEVRKIAKMPSWAAEELKQANLADKRLNKRLITIVENLASKPSASVPQASGDWANTKATYNFWDSDSGFDDSAEILYRQSQPMV
jgi:hypothetical protein